METQLIVGDIKTTLLSVLDKVDIVHQMLSETGLYTERVSGMALDVLATDTINTRDAFRRYMNRTDSGTLHDLYTNVIILVDRLLLIQRRVANVLDKDVHEVVKVLKNVVELTIAVRGQFIADSRGRDTTNDVIDKDGKAHRRNIHIKLEHQRILDAGRLSELD